MLKNLRQNKKLTQTELGVLIGVTGEAICQYEKNKRIPNIHNMQKLAQALDVDLKTILECFYGGPNEIEI